MFFHKTANAWKKSQFNSWFKGNGSVGTINDIRKEIENFYGLYKETWPFRPALGGLVFKSISNLKERFWNSLSKRKRYWGLLKG